MMWRMADFIISTNKYLLDFDTIYHFISLKTYWGLGRTPEAMEKAMNHSTYCFGVYHEKDGVRRQIGFARVMSDLVTFGYIADVFILPDYQGHGIGKWLIQTIVNHPDLKTIPKFILFTKTPGFYTHSDFKIFDQSSKRKFMERKL